jgi:hypothetical protein
LILTFAFDTSLRTTRIQRVVLDFPIVFLPFRLLNCATDEEEDGAVTVLKLSNGVMFRVPVKVQGMQLQAVVDTTAQVTLVSEEFYKSLDPALPKFMGITSPTICSFFCLRCRDTPLGS